ncbi:MAG: hypothetical protein ABIQ18_36140 [Umezawaea sp.]
MTRTTCRTVWSAKPSTAQFVSKAALGGCADAAQPPAQPTPVADAAEGALISKDEMATRAASVRFTSCPLPEV